MTDRLAHRGPDDEGIYQSDDGRATLGFRRLAILDPHPRANQPMLSGDGRYAMVFNGEIYNFAQIRAELSSGTGGHSWHSSGDSEVLLAAYAQWGEGCLAKLNGMYAFAIWDHRERSLFSARDRMGQKPFYYAVRWRDASRIDAFAFASELSALHCLDWIDDGISPSSLSDYLLLGYVPSPRTIYTGVSKLQPGHWMKVSADGLIDRSYFDAGGHLDSGIALEHRGLTNVRQTRRLVEAAVEQQMVSDVPIACFLSGGIDSSIVAACMRRTGRAVRTFSIGFDDPRYDETAYARRVASHLGTVHQEFRITPAAADDLPKLAVVYGEPFGDSSALPTYYLCREVSHQVKVALSGDGGDELFGGYERYRAVALSEKLRRMPLIGTLARMNLWQSLPGRHPKSKLMRLKRLQQSLQLPLDERYPSYVRIFDIAQLQRLFRPDFVLRTDPGLVGDRWYRTFLDHRDPVAAATALDRVTYLPEDLLTKVDRASMLNSLEVRSPFMDHNLVQFASTLNGDQLIGGGGKRTLRETFADDLPAEVFTRRKMGFAVPVGQWFRQSLRDLLRDALLSESSFAGAHFDQAYLLNLLDDHDRGTVDHSQRLYALLMLELWWHGRR